MVKPTKQSAGILLYRRTTDQIEVFLVHPGGPFFAHRDLGAWSLPKGEFELDEEPIEVARREFLEETGRDLAKCAPGSDPIALGSVIQNNHKEVFAWAVEGEWPSGLATQSNTFELEWPPGSGEYQECPEVDRGQLFDLETARQKLGAAQRAFLDRLIDRLQPPRPELPSESLRPA